MRIPELPGDYWERHFSDAQQEAMFGLLDQHWGWLTRLREAGWIATGGPIHRACIVVMDAEVIWWSMWTSPRKVCAYLLRHIDRAGV